MSNVMFGSSRINQAHQGTVKYIYAGPSWAVTSFPESANSTNLSQEWGINNISTAAHGTSVLWQKDKIKEALKTNKLPIIWIYNEPILDVENILRMNLATLVTRKDWKQLFDQCNQHCLEQINSLGVPVLLIGAHSDIVNCEYSNITVGCPSWQKWLAQRSGMSVEDGIINVTPTDGGNYKLPHCWGAEVVQRFLHMNSNVSPDKELLNSIWDMYYFWDELHRRDWFFEVHPNKIGNVEFAKFLKPTVDKFLEEKSK